jgi:hypothetical protein
MPAYVFMGGKPQRGFSPKHSGPMTFEQKAKIEEGVVACLDRCSGGNPYTELSAFLNELRASPDWHLSEIIELQTWLIRLLLYQSRSIRA